MRDDRRGPDRGSWTSAGAAVGALLWLLAPAAPARAGESPPWLADRGPGLPTSLFGTYVEARELLVYTFYEYTRTTAFEYQPRELGYTGSDDYLGRTTEQEGLVYLGYGISDRLLVELEAALWATNRFDKAANDPSAVPAHLRETGLGDVDIQLRWRWSEESAHRPELFSYLEATPPLQKSRHLIGTQDWEAALGFGVLRGGRWGTLTGRVALAYDGQGSKVELGEYAVEYLKRTSPRWRFVAALEGESDELSAIGEAQWFFSERAFLKLNCGFGLTRKAPDVAPEVGVAFRF